METRKKVMRTGVVLWVVFYALVVLLRQSEVLLWMAYLSSLAAIFLWSSSNKAIPIAMAVGVPLLEAFWMLVYNGVDSFISNMQKYSTFYGVSGLVGYIFWLLVLPWAALELSKIWQGKYA